MYSLNILFPLYVASEYRIISILWVLSRVNNSVGIIRGKQFCGYYQGKQKNWNDLMLGSWDIRETKHVICALCLLHALVWSVPTMQISVPIVPTAQSSNISKCSTPPGQIPPIIKTLPEVPATACPASSGDKRGNISFVPGEFILPRRFLVIRKQ